MSRQSRFNPLVFAALLCIAFGHTVDGATVSLYAVERNGTPISPTGNLTVARGDEIRADIFLSDWGAELPDSALGYQVVIAGVGYYSGDQGAVLPKGWCGLNLPTACSPIVPCLDTFPICLPSGLCACPSHEPSLGAWIDETRPDFVLQGCAHVLNVGTGSLNYQFAAVVADPSCTPVDADLPRYLGTLVLVISTDACGAFTIGIDSQASFIVGGPAQPNVVNPGSEPLILTIAGCQFPRIDCDPEHCAIDPRIPHSPIDSQLGYNRNSLVMHFPSSAEDLSIDDFGVSVVPDGPAPIIASLAVKGNDATLTLDGGIQPGVWTCIRQIGSNLQCCMGSLPGDVDQGGVAEETDVGELLDNLRGATLPELPLEQCDTDRTNLCTGSDLLSAVDLLTGAGAFERFDGATLPECPPMRIHP